MILHFLLSLFVQILKISSSFSDFNSVSLLCCHSCLVSQLLNLIHANSHGAVYYFLVLNSSREVELCCA